MRDRELTREEKVAMRDYKESHLTFDSKSLSHIQSLYRLGEGIPLEEDVKDYARCWHTLPWGIGMNSSSIWI